MASRPKTDSRAGKARPGNQSAGTARIKESELVNTKVDDLREIAKKRSVTGASSMRKADLVKAISETYHPSKRSSAADQPSSRGSAVRRGPSTSRSLQYAQEITSTGEKPDRPGRTLVTTNHDVIREWAQERDAQPATVEGSEHDGRAGVLRFDFPWGGRQGRLRPISWEEWFRVFDTRGLNFLYQESFTNGRPSNFFRLENPQREDA